MRRFPAFGARRLAAMLVVLAALFHVQWLAACEFMPMGGGEKKCCLEAGSDAMPHCDQPSGRHECVAPFAASATATKAPDRLTAADDAPAELLPVYAAAPWRPAVTADSSPRNQPAHLADGRTLYLSSGRLRL